MKKQIFPLLLLGIITSLGHPLIAEEKAIINAGKQNIELISMPETNRVPIDELRLFTEIFEQLKNNYVDPISDKALIQNAINGMLALDPHSKYYPKEEYERLQNQTTGTFAGIGIETHYDADKNTLIVEKVFEKSPAFEAQIKIKDQILKINGEEVSNIDSKKLMNKLQGQIGTKVTLSILRDDTNLDVTLKRDHIYTPSLSSAKLYNHEFAYFKLDRFQQKTEEEIVNALMELEVEATTKNSKIQGVILDLRDNRGGLLTASINVADLFLNEGLITYTAGQSDRFKERYEAKKGDIIPNIPLIILINSQSASGSEIVAGALQDHARALIVGETSYGKGSIQKVQPLKNGDAIRYTSARYYTPKGYSIQNEGITPDIIIPNITAKITTHNSPREIDNLGHLTNDEKAPENQKRVANFTYLIERGDFPLYEALNLLQVMSKTQSHK